MGTYNILQDHGLKDGDAADISITPYWVVMVLRYAEPLTSSKQRMAQRSPFHTGDVSFEDDVTRLNRTKKPLIITRDCVQLSVDASKGRYTQHLQAVLKHGGRNYLSAIMPGDWVFAWMMNSREQYRHVIRQIRDNRPANDWSDGLKFVGKVQDIRKVLAQQPGLGLRTVQYNLQAVAFGELDSAIFFDPNLSRNEPYIEKVLQHLSIPMAEIYTAAAEDARKYGGIDINKIFPAFIRAFIGDGVSGLATQSGGLQLAQGAAVATKEAPFAYVIPDGVTGILGIQTPSKESGVYSYADCLELIQGLQKYDTHTFPHMFMPVGTRYFETNFEKTVPPLAPSKPPNRHFTAHPLKGSFLPTAISFDNKTVWNLLSEFLNPAINEMYTALKYTPSGRIMPTLVVRQLPFTSSVLAEAKKDRVTAFLELPRWRAHPALIRAADIGRSDGDRINFVHIYGATTKNTLATEMSVQLTRFPPVADPQDVKRHGLRPNMGQVNVGPTDIVDGGPQEWMTLRADFLMGQHLMLSGVCSLVGVQSPIVPGDNFEMEDAVFHIESVRHHCQILPDGKKSFTTQLSLSHGVRSDAINVAAGGGLRTTKVKKKARVREDLLDGVSKTMALGQKATDDMVQNGQLFQGSADDYMRAETERIDGVEIDVLPDGSNPDVALFSGIYQDDNTTLDPEHVEDFQPFEED